ncbi:hypothetical protein J6590_002966 [Homalodisca vitripennis]|nr:hypothetical protein J6590_002966 [Homalodisca vitripennis]
MALNVNITNEFKFQLSPFTSLISLIYMLDIFGNMQSAGKRCERTDQCDRTWITYHTQVSSITNALSTRFGPTRGETLGVYHLANIELDIKNPVISLWSSDLARKPDVIYKPSRLSRDNASGMQSSGLRSPVTS